MQIYELHISKIISFVSFLLWLEWRILAVFGGEIEGAACVFLRWNGSSITEGFHAVLRLQWKTWWNMETDNENQRRFCILYTVYFTYTKKKKNKYNRNCIKLSEALSKICAKRRQYNEPNYSQD